MRIDKLGRNRKPLIEKSTPLMIRVDNETLFKLCDKFNIPYDDSAEIFDNETKKLINGQIKKIISNSVK